MLRFIVKNSWLIFLPGTSVLWFFSHLILPIWIPLKISGLIWNQTSAILFIHFVPLMITSLLFFKFVDYITIIILGSMCGLRNIRQILQWSLNKRVSEFLNQEFGIKYVLCYYWILCMLQMIKTETLNCCLTMCIHLCPKKQRI